MNGAHPFGPTSAAAGSGRSAAAPLVVETRPEPTGMVVSVAGELDLATAPEFRRRLLELIALPIERLTVDLADLRFVDSSGLAALDAGWEAAAERRVRLELTSVPSQARLVLELGGLASRFGLDGREPNAD